MEFIRVPASIASVVFVICDLAPLILNGVKLRHFLIQYLLRLPMLYLLRVECTIVVLRESRSCGRTCSLMGEIYERNTISPIRESHTFSRTGLTGD